MAIAERSPRLTIERAAALLFAPVTAFLAYAGYFRIFGALPRADDEGFFLYTAKVFHEAGDLYDRISSIYGPAHYEIVDAIFSILRLPRSRTTTPASSVLRSGP